MPAAVESRGHRQIPIVCPGHTRPLAEVQFCAIHDSATSESRTFLISACHDKMPMLRDAISGDWIGTFTGHKGAVWSCRLDPQGYLAATASGDFNVKVWDAITGKELHTFSHKHIVKTCEFSQDSRFLATGGHEGILRIYDLLDVFDAKQLGLKNTNTNTNTITDATPLMIPQCSEEKIKISKCVWLNDSTVIAAGSDGKIRFWSVKTSQTDNDITLLSTGVLVHTLTVNAEVRDMECKQLDNGRIVLTIAAGDMVSFFDLSPKEDGSAPSYSLIHSHKVPIHFREEGGASLHPTCTKFVAGGSDLWVRVFDFESGKELECLKGHHGPVRCVRYAPDGKTYATGSEDGTIRIWKTDPLLG